MPQGPVARIHKGSAVLHYFTGKVLSSQKQKETVVRGHGGGNQYNSSVSISSSTVDHHEFFLQDNEGREKSFKTVNWDFPCRDGHVLSVIWAIAEGQEQGPYVTVLNHSTGETHRIDHKSLAKTLLPSELTGKKLAIVAAAFVVGGVVLNWGLVSFVLVVAAIYAVFKAIANRRKAARDLLDSSALRDLEAQLSRVKPAAAIAPAPSALATT